MDHTSGEKSKWQGRKDSKKAKIHKQLEKRSNLDLMQLNPLLMMSGRRPVGCPPGLEGLCFVDNILVKQKVEVLEILTGFEMGNKYDILSGMGQRMMVAAEDTDFCTRCCCGRCRPFNFLLMDPLKGTELIHLRRGLRCSTCWCPCCLQKMEISAPAGNVIGYVEQNWSVCFPKYSVQNEIGETVLRIEGPFCTFSCFGSDVEFEILSKDGKDLVGRIDKLWGGLVKEAMTTADDYKLNFPMDLDVKCKAILIGAAILIDFMFFEAQSSKTDAPGMLAN